MLGRGFEQEKTWYFRAKNSPITLRQNFHFTHTECANTQRIFARLIAIGIYCLILQDLLQLSHPEGVAVTFSIEFISCRYNDVFKNY